MIQSMTGFGKSQKSQQDFKISVEIKTLNSKGVDVSLRLASLFREKELDIRKHISEHLLRGKIDVYISLEHTTEQAPVVINQSLVKNYMAQFKEMLCFEDSSQDLSFLKLAMRMPDVLTSFEESLSQEHIDCLFLCLQQALEQVKQFREKEGQALEQDFLFRIQNIADFLQEISLLDAQRIGLLRERLLKSVQELKEKYDENRFEQELIFYLEKLDITEERVRLQNHLKYFVEVLQHEENSGRKLSFLVQEIGREINTIGSKANHAPIQQLVVKMKDELEKIKEQIANVL